MRGVRRHIDGNPMQREEYEFPTVDDGVRGMRYINAAVESAESKYVHLWEQY